MSLQSETAGCRLGREVAILRASGSASECVKSFRKRIDCAWRLGER